MDLNGFKKDNFWNNHSLKDFEPIAFLQNIHSGAIKSVCFLKDGRLASSSDDCYVFIYNKITFKKEITIKEKKRIYYMNINKDGILITCLSGTYLNLYEIKGKNYKNIQTIKPYSLFLDIIGKFDGSFSIKKFIELKNGDIAILVWAYAISFYKKKKKKYSYLTKFPESGERITDLIELDNKQYIIAYKYEDKIEFLDMNSKKITETINTDKYFFSDSKNEMILMNKNDLLLAGNKGIIIIDIQEKKIIKKINLSSPGYLSYIFKLTNNISITGHWYNYIEQWEYDDVKKEIKIISFTNSKKLGHELLEASSISIFKNKLIVAPYDNTLYSSSLIIYKYKNK